MTVERVWQPSFEDLGTPLQAVTFVVVDLETNGLPHHDAGITEIGAVKVRGGEVLSEFQTLVNPGTDIPPFIALLTGITNELVADAPDIATALPAFFDWAGDAVYVAHNAGFDISFLKAGAAKIGGSWHSPQVLDTLTIARAVLLPDEVPNRKLGTLAAYFGSPTEPVHRALADARATVHVLHSLFERLGSVGAQTLEEVLNLGVQMNATRRKKRSIADHLPQSPGVYVFKDENGRPLYVGKSNNLRKRALTYFTRSEDRSRMGKMVDLAASVTGIECATELEASIRELRLILEKKPAFNRAGIYSERNIWIRLSNDIFPRLTAVRSVRPDLGSLHLGPVRNMEQASLVIDAVTSVIGLRTCSQRLKVDRPSPTCALAELERCVAPCELRLSPAEYGELVNQFKLACAGDSLIETTLRKRLQQLASAERYEEAAVWRDRLAAWLQATNRSHRYAPLASIADLVAASETVDGFELHCIRFGKLAGAAKFEKHSDLNLAVTQLLQTSMQVETPALPAPAGSMAELRLINSWLHKSGALLLHASEPWSSNWPNQLSASAELAELQKSREISQQVVPNRKQVRFTAPR